MAWLLGGHFERGWPEYEWRWRGNEAVFAPLNQPLWDGSALEGRTILLHAEQGLGDTIQFIRYARLVRARGGTVVVACPTPLIQLLTGCAGIDQLIPQGSILPPFDVYAPLLSLPGILGTSLGSVPAEVPYLVADAELERHWREKLGPLRAFKIGIAWQGNPGYLGDSFRSIPLTHFATLARVEGVRLFSLQKGPGSEQLSALGDLFPVTDLGSQLDNATGAFVETAAVMKSLDLIITSDTAVAHLAGALGVPVWVALPAVPDWRWMLDRADSPWYPTMRLFRQTAWGQWESVFARLASAVSGWIGT
jgi:hypothetical protein